MTPSPDVDGIRLDASGQSDVVPRQDRRRRGVVLHPNGMAGPWVLIDDAAARTLARGISAQDDKDDKDEDGEKHRDEEQEKRDTDGYRPVDPDIVREPKPGKWGQ